MTTIGEIRLYRVHTFTPNRGDLITFASKMEDGQPGSYRMELPQYAVPPNAEHIDVRVQVENAQGWHPTVRQAKVVR